MMAEPVLNNWYQVDRTDGYTDVVFANYCEAAPGGMLACYSSWPPGSQERESYVMPTNLISRITPLPEEKRTDIMKKTIQVQAEFYRQPTGRKRNVN